MKRNNLIVLSLAIALVVSGIFWALRPERTVIVELDGSSIEVDNTGSLSGPDVYSYMKVHGTFQQGGFILASSTADTTETIQASDLLDYVVVDLTPITGATTYTLPATTTFPSIDNVGDYRTWVFRNATTSPIAITIGAGTGIDLQEPDGQNVVIGQNNLAWVTCYRKADTDIVCRIDESIPAD